jgi:hypothetical protein
VAAIRCGLSGSRLRPTFNKYFLLGDDLVIMHDAVASEYKNLISQLGMPFSEAKTHTSLTTFEFAKRWFHNNKEITGFSCSGLLSVWKRYPLLSNFLTNRESHGWILPIEKQPSLILAIHKVLSAKFIFERSERHTKLHLLFNQLLTLKGRNKTGYVTLMETLKAQFGLDLLAQFALLAKPVDIIELIYTEAKRRLVEKDLYTFQSDAYKVNSKLNKFVSDKITGAGVDQATGEFLKETLSVVLNWNHPMVLCLNNMIDRSTEFLMNYWDPEISLDFLFEVGLSKYKVSKGVFSMRASSSIILAESAVLKEFITVSRLFCEGKLIPTINDQGFNVLTPPESAVTT